MAIRTYIHRYCKITKIKTKYKNEKVKKAEIVEATKIEKRDI